MNKLVKGSIAGAAGIALLLGGAGTLAYWNASATLEGAGTVTAGTLDINGNDDGAWVSTVGGSNVDIANFLIVPGDTLTYTETLAIVATGDNLKFNVTNNIGDAVSGFAHATVTQTVIDSATNAVFPASVEDGTYSVKVTVTVNFPIGADTANNVDQGKTINLSNAAITVTQVL